MKVKREEASYDIQPVIIETVKYIVVSDSEYKNIAGEKKLTGKDAVKQSMKDSVVSLEEYVGGTGIFDYDENYQYPVYTRQLAMTTIILNSDEKMSEGSAPYLSDTERWEITGDVWETEEGSRQIIMVKPTALNLETNMLVMTDKRIYHFVLYSTAKEYQPMIKFRYPKEKKFITENTRKPVLKSVSSVYENLDPDLVSFNYLIKVPFFSRKIDWIPEKVYDDGSHTYILLPEVVLQKEFPAVWENDDHILTYEVDPEHHNLIIINKLIEEVTLGIGKKKIRIIKKKGQPVFSIRR